MDVAKPGAWLKCVEPYLDGDTFGASSVFWEIVETAL